MIQLESEVIGAILIQPTLLTECDLSEQHFQHESLRRIYRTILDLADNGEPVDAVTVSESLGGEWSKTVFGLVNDTYTTKNFGWRVAKVREAYQQRQAREIGQMLLDGSGPDEAVKLLMDLNASRKDYDHDATSMVSAALNKLEQLHEGMVGVPTGLTKLDEALGGLHGSDLIVVGARPAMGKTAFMLSIADRCGVPVGIISGEQPVDQVGFRLLAQVARVPVHRMRKGNMSDDDWSSATRATSSLKDRRVWINDRPGIGIDELCRQARKWVMRHGIKLLCVDYIQKVKAPGQDRRNEVAAVVVALKDLARELQIPVLALAQVKREAESRANKRPMVSDLKEAGEIEQEADQIILLYRDEVYDENSRDINTAELIIGKNRHGPTGTIRCAWLGEYMAFRDLAP